MKEYIVYTTQLGYTLLGYIFVLCQDKNGNLYVSRNPTSAIIFNDLKVAEKIAKKSSSKNIEYKVKEL